MKLLRLAPAAPEWDDVLGLFDQLAEARALPLPPPACLPEPAPGEIAEYEAVLTSYGAYRRRCP